MLQNEKCIHYWIINEGNIGTCKKCQAQKQFPGFHEVLVFNNNRLLYPKRTVMLKDLLGGEDGI